jgi:hypothetical protein
MMFSVAVTRAIASLCGMLCVLCAAVSAPILFMWALDNSRPVSVMPLLLGGGLLLVAALLFIIRRALQIGVARSRSLVTHHPA